MQSNERTTQDIEKGTETKMREAKHSADSAIRSARALFGKEVLRQLGDFPFPSSLPPEAFKARGIHANWWGRVNGAAFGQMAVKRAEAAFADESSLAFSEIANEPLLLMPLVSEPCVLAQKGWEP